MAQQTKNRSRGRSRRSIARSSSANGRTRARSRSSASQRKTRTASTRRSAARSSNNTSALGTAKDATVKGANAAGNAVTSAARKLKTPAIAAGAGLAGVAGGIALARGSRKKLLGVSLPNGGTARSASKNLGNVAKNLGAFAERTGRVAEQVRVASEAIGESNTRSKSPVEVVLEGLTSRSQSRAG
jgi:hypothetical protein